MLGGARRVRRTMAPLNDLALRVDELGRMQLSGGKMETLEQAIERASVDSPSVTTGDADLASIEVALNRLLRQMQEAKLQQMRFVNDASHELRTPIAVIQGYVNMLDRWGKDDPDVLAESIASLKAESEHMQGSWSSCCFWRAAMPDARSCGVRIPTWPHWSARYARNRR